MKTAIEKTMKFLFIVIVILALAVPTPVLAQDDLPTGEPPATEVVVEEPTEEVTEAPVVDPTVAPTEAPVVDPTAAPTEAPVEEVVEPVADIVEALADADVVLVDENGDPLVLGSVAAEEAINDAAPWFVDPTDPTFVIAYLADCTGWVAPEGYAGGQCIVSETPVQAAIDDPRSDNGEIFLSGTVTETITITKNIKINGGGATTFDPVTIPVTDESGNTVAVITIDGSDSEAGITVVIEGVTIDGSGLTDLLGTGVTDLAGILVNEANVELIETAIVNFLATEGVDASGLNLNDSTALDRKSVV